MKTDWGISLFFLTPLALVAIPSLRLQKIALFRIVAIWLVFTLAVLAASRTIAAREIRRKSQRRIGLWRAFRTRPRTDASLASALQLAMGRGRRDHGYRRADDVLQSGSSGAVHARRTLGVGADLARGGQAARLHRHLRYVGRAAAGLRSVDGGQCRSAEPLVITTQRFFHGHSGPATSWKIYIVPPAQI